MTTIEPPAPRPVIETHATAFFDHQLATVTLTEPQARTLCDIFEPPAASVVQSWLRDPGQRMADEIRAWAAEDRHHAERWGADFAELARLCESWHPAQAFAVLDAVHRYSVTGADQDLPGRKSLPPGT
ncbi:hypothetical protein [Nocardia abscessus]|uniref:hypothetical protein n=1 Tax=Nocardia abscessus TaxID=120957 RepID=UPI0002EBEB37|nr:hypothetical protein [Nocardia abscessus]MCC3328276.1 hypothetical protein [Nocardia abscessus]